MIDANSTQVVEYMYDHLAKAGSAIHNTYDPLKGLVEGSLNKSLSYYFDGVKSLKRPDAVDLTNNILYELKPYNKASYQRAIRQTGSYLDEIKEANKGRWIAIIDIYY